MSIRHYCFIENNTGKEFIVGEFRLEFAEMTAREIGDAIARNYGEAADVEFLYEMSDKEAEASGLDEY